MFIAIEGIDGSGKTTLARRLAAYLMGQGHPTMLTAEPSHERPIGATIRSSVIGTCRPIPPIAPQAIPLLFAADRIDHAEEIRRHLAAGCTVVCDRYRLTTRAYQGYGARVGGWEEWLNDFCDLYEVVLPEPDLFLYVRTSLDVAERRRRNRGIVATTGHFEENPVQKVAAEIYEREIERMTGRSAILNGDQCADHVFGQALGAIDGYRATRGERGH